MLPLDKLLDKEIELQINNLKTDTPENNQKGKLWLFTQKSETFIVVLRIKHNDSITHHWLTARKFRNCCNRGFYCS